LAFDHYLTDAYRISPFLNTLAPSKICIVERLMVDEEHRGSATMLRMFNKVMEFILAQGIELLLINAEAQHSNSYIKLGCVPFTRQFLYPGIGLVSPMALVVGNFQHLKRVKSPFSLLASIDDIKYCQHTQQLIKIINYEATIAGITPKLIQTTIQPIAAANQSLYSRTPLDYSHRLRLKVATA
jgi:hypothetical protein